MSGHDTGTHRFLWVDEARPVLGGQWMWSGEGDETRPAALADVVAAAREDARVADPLPVHVDAVLRVVRSAGALEDAVFPDAEARLRSVLLAAEAVIPEIDPDTAEGVAVRRGAEALEKLAADLAELVEEQLEGGSLAQLPPDSTRALCQATQTAWRLRRLVEPPGPLYL